jgi:hypothetical protein
LLAVLTVAVVGASVVPAQAIDPSDRAEVLSYLQQNIDDHNAIIRFYQGVGSWERMRALRSLDLPSPLWQHLADARTHLVKRLYADVHAEMFKRHQVYLDDPKKESHFIGTPPSDPNFKGVFSDLDVGMFLDPEMHPRDKFGGRTLPERQVLQIEAKRRLEAKLAQYGPDSGFLFDTNLYTTPELFDESRVGSEGRRQLDRYNDVLAYLAIRVGCDDDRARWLDLKQRLLNRAREAGLERPVLELIEEAEAKYDEFERLKENAIAEAKRKGQKVYAGLDEQAVTRHYEDRMLSFIAEHGASLSADTEAGRALRAQYNMRKADYEASLRESYFTYAAQVYIVKWSSLGAKQKQAFLNDPNQVRRVRADQARFILHYLQHPPGDDPGALRYKVQKITKYEQRELNVLIESKGRPLTLTGFQPKEVLELFSAMKGESTPEEAWLIWRRYNFNRLQKRDLTTEIQNNEAPQAEEYATKRAKAYLEHIEEKLIDIATELPSS